MFTWIKQSLAKIRLPRARSLDECSTPEEVAAYAYNIRAREPNFANDLLAAVTRAERDLGKDEQRMKSAV